MVAEKILNTNITGVYHFFETLNGKPAYKLESGDLLIFYAAWWKLDHKNGYNNAEWIGYIQSTEDTKCPGKISNEKWNYFKNQLPEAEIKVIECKCF